MRLDGLADHLRKHPHRGGMIYCPAHKWLWMKPGKCAGSSIARDCIEPHVETWRHGGDGHEQFADWLANVTDGDLGELFIWATIRNPWSRLVSAIFYFHLNTDDFFRDPAAYLWCSRPLRMHLCPLHFYTHLGCNQYADALVYTENVQADFDAIHDRLGVPRTTVPRMNTTTHKPFERYFAEARRLAVVDVIWPLDAELYGYAVPQG